MKFNEFIKVCHELRSLHPRDCYLSRRIKDKINDGSLDISKLSVFEHKFSDTIKKDLQKQPNKVITSFLLGRIHKCRICGKYTYFCHPTCSIYCQGQYANEIRNKNNLKKYGVKNVFQLDSVKEKSKITMKEKYGVEYSSKRGKEYIQKVKKTLMERYGVEHPNQIPEIKQKISNLFIKRNLGLEHLTDDELWKHIRDTVNKYVVDNELDFISCRHELGCSQVSLRKILRKLKMSKYIHKRMDHTYTEFYISNNIAEKTILGDREILEGREIDVFVPSLKLGIEYNGEFYHNSDHRDESYHLWKTEKCLQKGIQLFHCFEFDDPDIFINKAKYYSGTLNKIGARKTKVQECAFTDEVNNFVDNNSTFQDCEFLRKCTKYKYLKYDDEIVLLMGIKNNECLIIPKIDTMIQGGISKLLKGENLTVLVNRNYSNGFTMKKLGYSLIDTVKPFLVKECYNVGLYKFKYL